MLSSLILLVAINTWHQPYECVILADNGRIISTSYDTGYMSLYDMIQQANVTFRSKEIALHALWKVYSLKIKEPDIAWSILFNECMGKEHGT